MRWMMSTSRQVSIDAAKLRHPIHCDDCSTMGYRIRRTPSPGVARGRHIPAGSHSSRPGGGGFGLHRADAKRSAPQIRCGLALLGHVGLPRGCIARNSDWIDAWLVAARGPGVQSVIQVLRPISPLAWTPIAILWFGVGGLAAAFLIFLASFLPLTVTAINAVAGIPDIYLNAGRNFGLRRTQLVYRVLYPAVMPQLIIGVRITIGIAWLVVVAAEMIAVNSGLGFLIVDARNAGNRYDLVVAGMVTIGVIGLLLDTGIRSLEKVPSVRWGYSDD